MLIINFIRKKQNMIRYLALGFALLIHTTRAQPVPKPPLSKHWQTLSGRRPHVVARGGLSGVFPDSSEPAYTNATTIGFKGTILFCDLQLTKDSVPFCLSDIKLDNTTNVRHVFPDVQKTYNVNGKPVTGWFTLDFMAEELFPNVLLIQSIYSRTDVFDGIYHITLLDDLIMSKPAGIWVNVQYDRFYSQQKLSPATVLKDHPNLTSIQYLSSPDIGFLQSIKPITQKTRAKLIFRFMQPDEVEPTTNKPYSAILQNLASIKSFASGILVPKEYVVPISKELYLEAPTNLVNDAHKLGLEVYASGFANDMPASYNYSYDPTLEYLQFVDNPQFSVDGVLTDFAGTASEAIACIVPHHAQKTKHQPIDPSTKSSHIAVSTKPPKANPLIISHHGASGDFSPCTDLAYEKAVKDGADVLDCSVQISKDGIVFCSPSADIANATNAKEVFKAHINTIPEIQEKPGVFSFGLDWAQIQKLTLKMSSLKDSMPRNPVAIGKGKLLTLAEFLDLAKKRAVPGILINIENAAYLKTKSLDIACEAATSLEKAGLSNQTKQQVFIQSDEEPVFTSFKVMNNYKKVFSFDTNKTSTIEVDVVKKFADTVRLPKASLIQIINYITANDTGLVRRMHEANLLVHVSVLYNEYNAILFDMFADPLVDLATFVEGLGVDGVVTDYPATAKNYLRSPCRYAKDEDYWIRPVDIGEMLTLTGPGAEMDPLLMNNDTTQMSSPVSGPNPNPI